MQDRKPSFFEVVKFGVKLKAEMYLCAFLLFQPFVIALAIFMAWRER